MDRAIQSVIEERGRQNEKWGEQRHNWVEWIAILGEEFGESSQAAVEAHWSGGETPRKERHLREEMVQVAAVAVQIIEHLDERLDYYES